MKRMWIAAVGTIVGAGMIPHAAFARTTAAPFMPLGTAADAPVGFVDFCNRDRAECAAGVTSTVADRVASGAADAANVAHSVTAALPDEAPRLIPALSFRWSPHRSAAPYSVVSGWRPEAAVFTGSMGTAPLPFTFCRDLSTTVVAAPPPDTAAIAMIDAAVGLVRLPVAIIVPPAPVPVLVPVPVPGTARGDDGTLMRMVRKVNSTVNRHVIQASDLATAGVEDRWNRLSGGNHPAGDCEDISIEKRLRLIADGFPPERLFYAVAYKSGMGLHVVLVARLANGDVVLDSLSPHVLAWNKVNYRWIRVQLPGAPLAWAHVGTA